MTKNHKQEQRRRQNKERPLIKKQDVIEYLTKGETSSSYKEGTPYVDLGKLRTLLLEAGYTELALYRSFYGTHTDLERSTRFPQESNKLTLTISNRNRYGLKPGEIYDAVTILQDIMTHSEPDLHGGKDDLRSMVLQQIDQLEKLKPELQKTGHGFISLKNWAFSISGELIFWLNPRYQSENRAGWYTLDSLRLWLNDDPSNPVGKRTRNYSSKTKTITFRAQSEQSLRKFSQTGELNRRILNIHLMGCPFPDLVKRYSSEASLG